jgi:hypothetical protein
MRFVDSAKVLRSLSVVKNGEVISLDLPLAWRPGKGGRAPLKRTVHIHNAVRAMRDGRYTVINDDAVEFPLQGSSQWDGLAHFGLIEPGSRGVFYGGRPLNEVGRDQTASSLGIENISGGVVTRGIFFDFVDFLGGREQGFAPQTVRISDVQIEAYLNAKNLTLEPGDAAFVYVGVQALLAANGGAYPRNMAGLDGSSMRIWKDAKVCAVITDNPTPEAVPPLDMSIHIGAIRDNGIFIGELWSLDKLADACRRDGRYEFLLASKPLDIPGAFGSPANAMAIR